MIRRAVSGIGTVALHAFLLHSPRGGRVVAAVVSRLAIRELALEDVLTLHLARLVCVVGPVVASASEYWYQCDIIRAEEDRPWRMCSSVTWKTRCSGN